MRSDADGADLGLFYTGEGEELVKGRGDDGMHKYE